MGASEDAGEVLVESVGLAGLDESGLSEPGVGGPSTVGGVAQPDDVVVPADEEPPTTDEPSSAPAGADEQVVVGLSDVLDIPADQVSALGVTWDPTVSEPVQVDVRLGSDGTWGAWTALEVEDEDEGRPGTAPMVLTEATQAQVRATTASGQEPSGLALSVIGVGDQPQPVVEDGSAVVTTSGFVAPEADGVQVRNALTVTAPSTPAGVVSDVASVATAAERPTSPVSAVRPAIHLRSEWGAAPFIGTPEPADVQGAVVHHTVSSNDYAAADVPAMLRSIQAYHVSGRGWSDIGYNFLVDRFGRIWEGRQGGVDQEIRGVHASEANSVSTGVSVIGNFDVAAVPQAVISSVSQLIAWKLALHKVIAGDTFVLGTTTFPNIIGHRDVPTAQTACPGRYLYALLPTIRARAEAAQSFNPVWYDRGILAEGSVDVLATGATTRVLTLDATPVADGTQIGNGWQVMDLMVTGPAFAGGTTRDLVAREAATGRLVIYRGTATGSFSSRTVLGPGWDGMSQVMAPGDVDGDARPDLLAVERATGTLWLYPGKGTAAFGPRRAIGNGWQSLLAMSGAGDLTGDRRPDLLGVLPDGTVKVYPTTVGARFLAAYSAGRVPTTVDTIVAPGDLTQDARPDLLARDADSGQVLTLPGTGGLTFGTAQPWTAPWDPDAAVISGAGWRVGAANALLVASPDGSLVYRPARVGVAFDVAVSTGSTADAVESLVVGDVSGGPEADVLTKDSAGRLFVSETQPDGTLAAPVQIGVGWSGFTQLVPIGDANYDGSPDVLAKYSDGRLFLYPFDPTQTAMLPPVQVGNGFAAYRLVGAPGWNDQTGATVLAIDTGTGALRSFSTRGEKYLTGGATIGSGWQSFSDLVALDDVLGDGRPALLARRADGTTYLYPGTGHGGFLARLPVEPLTGATGGNLR